MVDYYDIRHFSPSVSFSFARLGAFLSSSSGGCPQIEGFTLKNSNLGLILADLYPLLHQSLNWFQSLQGMSVEERIGSKIRSSDLETGLSSSGDTVGVETNTAALVPLSS